MDFFLIAIVGFLCGLLVWEVLHAWDGPAIVYQQMLHEYAENLRLRARLSGSSTTRAGKESK